MTPPYFFRGQFSAFSFNYEHEYLAEEVVDQWYGPKHAFFKLRADDGNLYILRHQTSVPDGEWEFVSFRETKLA